MHETWKYNLELLLLYLLAVMVLLSPYFTPFSNIGPGGILRGDQVLIPFLVLTIVLFHLDGFVVPNNLIVIAIALLVGLISLSIFMNWFHYQGSTGIGDLYDVVIWIMYFCLVAAISGNISTEQARRTILFIIGLLIGVAGLAILQSVNIGVATETIAPIYTTRLDTITRSPTATLKNPNSLGKIMLFPFLFSLAQAFRIYVTESVADNTWNFASWLLLCALFATVIIASDARSVLVGLIFASSVIGAVVVLEKIGDDLKRHKLVAVTTISMIVGLYLLIAVFEVGRIASLQNPLQDNSLQTRFILWERILPVILERPLIGYGPSKTAQLAAGVPYVDSGFLSWWYHYGLFGIIAYILFICGSIKSGLNTVINRTVFVQYPVFWSAGLATIGWITGSILIWGFAGVPQDRRVFTLILFILSLIITESINRRSA